MMVESRAAVSARQAPIRAPPAPSGATCRCFVAAAAVAAVVLAPRFRRPGDTARLPRREVHGPPRIRHWTAARSPWTIRRRVDLPPEFPPPTFSGASPTKAPRLAYRVTFDDGLPGLHATSHGERMRVGEIDPRCVAPRTSPAADAAAGRCSHLEPDAETWQAIKNRSQPPRFRHDHRDPWANPSEAVSVGRVSIRTSKDPSVRPSSIATSR